MREANKDIVRLQHILDAIRRIRKYSEGRTYEHFIADDMMYYAIVKNIEIIGEAANMLTFDFREKHSRTPWNMVTGMRNYIVHEYYQVDNTIVWDVVRNDLPVLEKQVTEYIGELLT